MPQDQPEDPGRVHYVRNQAEEAPAPAYTRWERFTRFLSGLMAAVRPDGRNSSAPVGEDVSAGHYYTGFNANGRDRGGV